MNLEQLITLAGNYIRQLNKPVQASNEFTLHRFHVNYNVFFISQLYLSKNSNSSECTSLKNSYRYFSQIETKRKNNRIAADKTVMNEKQSRVGIAEMLTLYKRKFHLKEWKKEWSLHSCLVTEVWMTWCKKFARTFQMRKYTFWYLPEKFWYLSGEYFKGEIKFESISFGSAWWSDSEICKKMKITAKTHKNVLM